MSVLLKKKRWAWWANQVATNFPSIDVSLLTNWLFLGDSIMNGSNATAGNSYREQLATNYATTNTNLAASGRGVWAQIDNIHRLSFTRSSTMIIMSAGLNDVRRGSTALTFRKIMSAEKTVIKKAFAGGTSVFAGSTSVTRAGTWSGQALNTFGGAATSGVLGNAQAGATSSATNSTITWSFSGDNVWITFSASDPTVARSDAEIRVDGTLIDTITDLDDRYDAISDGSYDNKRGPDTRYYFGLGAGAHTLEIKATSATALAVDIMGVFETNMANLGALIVQEIPKITDYAKAGLDQASDAVINSINAQRYGLVTEWQARGYPIYWMPVMTDAGGDYSTAAGIDTDGVHPTNAGHALLYSSYTKRFI